MHKKETIVLHTKAHFLKIFLFEAKIMYFLDFNTCAHKPDQSWIGITLPILVKCVAWRPVIFGQKLSKFKLYFLDFHTCIF